MTLIDFFIFFFIALLFASILSYGFKRSSGLGGFLGILILFFLIAWASRLWLTPAGPVFWGFGWFPVVFAVLIFLLLIAAASPEDKSAYHKPVTAGEQAESTKGLIGLAAGFSIFFWFLIFALIIAIIARLMNVD